LRALVVVALLGGGCHVLLDPCENELVARMPSPDGRHDAVVFIRDCGATTGFSTQLSITAPGKVPHQAGTTFIVDDKVDVHATWQSARSLRITFPASAHVLRREPRAGDIAISYAP
jgi:hypothetical protein